MSQRTLLIVDDEPDIRESLQEAFTDEGYKVIIARNGKEALQLIPTLERPCAIILDIIMPVMSGAEVYEAMINTPALADIPVVISTSAPFRAPRGVPVLKKPLNLDALLNAISDIFSVFSNNSSPTKCSH